MATRRSAIARIRRATKTLELSNLFFRSQWKKKEIARFQRTERALVTEQELNPNPFEEYVSEIDCGEHEDFIVLKEFYERELGGLANFKAEHLQAAIAKLATMEWKTEFGREQATILLKVLEKTPGL